MMESLFPAQARKWAPVSVLIAGAVLLLTTAAVVVWLAEADESAVRQQTFGQAAVLGDLTAITMRWSAEHGHIFVEKREGPGRDRSGAPAPGLPTLSAISPGTMAREFSEYAQSHGAFGLHVASLRTADPEAAPDPWEKAALIEFAAGLKEKSGADVVGGKPSYRVMRPLYAEPSCLVCHPGQGYKVGDVLGGISVDLPFDSPILSRHRYERAVAGFLLSFLVAFILALYFIIWRLMKRLSGQAAELKRLNDAKDEFLGMAAHDFRSPLTVAIACVSVLKESLSDKTHLEMLSAIERSSVRMLALVTSLLDLGAIENGRLVLQRQTVDVSAFLEESMGLYRNLGRTIGVDIRGDISPDIGTAPLDPDRVRQAVENLIGNSLKLSSRGTVITVSARKVSGRLEIWVEDRAGGISPEIVSQVVDGPIVSAGPSQPGRKDSHGLGLAIVKRMVRAHGGTFQIDSRPGIGTKIVLSFPLTPGEAAP
jgi:signal transduction histidine kinase